jgi:NAD(P)-dependent dehydrogenase (short-subunit alcohol dehydrogenase family)
LDSYVPIHPVSSSRRASTALLTGPCAPQPALITDGTTGIGQATGARFAAGGARVVTSGRSVTDSLPDGVQFICADAFTLDGVRHLAEQAQELLGDVHIVVNNAGATPRMGGVLDIADDEWLKDLTINFLAAVGLYAALLPSTYQRGSGSIVNISSSVRCAQETAAAQQSRGMRTHTSQRSRRCRDAVKMNRKCWATSTKVRRVIKACLSSSHSSSWLAGR